MIHRRGFARLFRLIHPVAARVLAAYAVVYLVTQAGAPILDASLERAAVGGRAHVEAEQSAACSTHDHQACQLCRTLRTVPRAAAPVPSVPLAATVYASVSAAQDRPAARRLDPSRSPRAPPLS